MAGAFAQSDEAILEFAFLIAVQLGNGTGREVGLFINDYIPIPGLALSDLSEPSLADYARETINLGSWTEGIDTHVAILTAPGGATFTTADATGELCYGYFVYDPTAVHLDWAQRFDTPLLLKDGLPIIFTPRYKFKDCGE